MSHDENTKAAEHHEMSANSHRAAATCHENGDHEGEHRHCCEGVKHSEAAHEASVAAQSASMAK